MNHVMVDIEALGRYENAAILSIGACAFEEDQDELRSTFEVVFDLEDVMRTGGTVDAATLKWWMFQSEEARQKAFNGTIGLRRGLRSFAEWYRDTEAERVWANGITYDINILAGSFRRASVSMPWRYNAVRDTRLFRDFDIAGAKEFSDRMYNDPNLLQHDALSDAIRQAEIVKYQLDAINFGLTALEERRTFDPSDTERMITG